MATTEEHVDVLDLIDKAALLEGVMIDFEWNRRVYYQIDCSHADLVSPILVLVCSKREGETMKQCLVRSVKAFGEWLIRNADAYNESRRIGSDDGAEVLHRLRETFVQC